MQFWDSVFSWIGDSLSENWRGLVTHGVGYCIGIIVLFLRYSAKSYRICFQKSCTKLIDGALPAAVKITVDGKVARRLSATKIVVWNGGYRALKSDQVPDPITMSFGEGDRIYRHCLFVTKESNRVRVERDGDHVLRMKFSNLDRHDGIALDILHDSEIEYPSLNGTILEHKGFKDCGEIMFTPDRTKLLPKARRYNIAIGDTGDRNLDNGRIQEVTDQVCGFWIVVCVLNLLEQQTEDS